MTVSGEGDGVTSVAVSRVAPSDPDAGSGQLVHISTPVVDRVMAAIIQAAENPAVDVAKMKELLALQKELMVMQAEQQFAEAYHRLSGMLPRFKKTKAVEFKGREAYKFVPWDEIDEIIRPILDICGFSMSWDSAPRQGDGGGLIVTGTLAHTGGHKRTSSIPVPLDTSGGKNSIQGYGSALRYGIRYTATALLNLVTEDDDDGVRGGQKFINADEAAELRALMALAKRQEGPFLDRLFGGSVHSCEEIEAGAFVVVKNTLASIIDQKAKKDQG